MPRLAAAARVHLASGGCSVRGPSSREPSKGVLPGLSAESRARCVQLDSWREADMNPPRSSMDWQPRLASTALKRAAADMQSIAQGSPAFSWTADAGLHRCPQSLQGVQAEACSADAPAALNFFFTTVLWGVAASAPTHRAVNTSSTLRACLSSQDCIRKLAHLIFSAGGRCRVSFFGDE